VAIVFLIRILYVQSEIALYLKIRLTQQRDKAPLASLVTRCFCTRAAAMLQQRGDIVILLSWVVSASITPPANFSIEMPEARDNFSASTNLSTFHSLIHK
jgi:hypothetical protein